MKKRSLSRLVAVAISVVMFVTTIPFSVSAMESSNSTKSSWSSFRGNSNNMGVVDAYTPTNPSAMETKYFLKMSWMASYSAPIIVDDALILLKGNKIVKINKNTGEVLCENTMVGSISWGITSPTYGDGMIFAQLGNGTIQAFDAKTLTSLWVYKDALKGQSNSPITYSDGYIYTGFWKGEDKETNFVCLDVKDEDINSTNEVKKAKWTYTNKGGFYWAGSIALGDYVIVGSDDGTRGCNGESKLLVFNKFDGTVVSEKQIQGDQRSTISYSDGKIYFTTKNCRIYSADINIKNGELTNLKSTDMGAGQSTSTPVVYKGRVYVGVGVMGSNGGMVVLDSKTLEKLYFVQLPSQCQCSFLLSTAYEKETGYIYLYGTCNTSSKRIEILKLKPDCTSADDVEQIPYKDLSVKQYCISSLICDKDGTLYFRNDGAFFAVGLTDDGKQKLDEDIAKQFDRFVDSISPIDLNSLDLINQCYEKYNKLTDKQKKFVKGYNKINNYMNQYLNLLKLDTIKRFENYKPIENYTKNKELYLSYLNSAIKNISNAKDIESIKVAYNNACKMIDTIKTDYYIEYEISKRNIKPEINSESNIKSETNTIKSPVVANVKKIISSNVDKDIQKQVDEKLNSLYSIKSEEFTKSQVDNIISTYKLLSKLDESKKSDIINSKEFKKLISKVAKRNHCDAKSGISVTGSNMPWYAKVEISNTKLNDKNQNKVKEALGKSSKEVCTIDININDLINKNKEYQPNGEVLVNIPAPKGLSEFDKVVVAHIKHNGELELIDAKIIDGKINFKAKSFSVYSVIGVNENSNVVSEKTNDKNNKIIWLSVILIAVGIITFVIIKKKKSKLN